MKKIKVLYVEDEPFLGKIVKDALEGQNYETLLVEDGAKVIKAYTSFNPDICILDIMLPNTDGLTLGKQIRELDSFLPIIFLTAKTTPEDLVKGFESGGTDYIRKPFSIKELFARIDNQLNLLKQSAEKPEAGSKEEYVFGKIRFTPKALKLVCGEKEITLTLREAEVLNVLADHPNKSVDRKMLLLKVWGDDSYFNSRNLDVYIRKLRKHLSCDPRIEILTLKGLGYQFMVPVE